MQRNDICGDKSQCYSSKIFVPENSIYSFSELKLLRQFILIHKLLYKLYLSRNSQLKTKCFSTSLPICMHRKKYICFKSIQDTYTGDICLCIVFQFEKTHDFKEGIYAETRNVQHLRTLRRTHPKLTSYPAIQWAAKSSSKWSYSSLTKSNLIFRWRHSQNRERVTFQLKVTTICLIALKLSLLFL